MALSRIDFEDIRARRMKQIAYLGRYAGLCPTVARHCDGRWLHDLAEATAELVRAENSPRD